MWGVGFWRLAMYVACSQGDWVTNATQFSAQVSIHQPHGLNAPGVASSLTVIRCFCEYSGGLSSYSMSRRLCREHRGLDFLTFGLSARGVWAKTGTAHAGNLSPPGAQTRRLDLRSRPAS
jgi:hypothetical protein